MNFSRRLSSSSLLALLAASPSSWAQADHHASPAIELGTITVRESSQSLISPSADKAAEDIRRIPGSAAVVSASRYEHAATTGLGDALAREPGIYAQAAGGQQSVKLSIRGSGLASPIGLRGIALLRDGMPLLRADGVGDPSYADPFNAHYIEVYRGASALQYGAATLGGAINLVSPTGYSHAGRELRVEGGSHGYLHWQARAGQVFNNGMDAFVSAGSYRTDGSLDHASQSVNRLYSNLGFRFTPRSEGRLHFNIDQHDQDIVNPVTLAQLRGEAASDDPPPSWPNRKIRTQPQARLAYQHTLRFNEDDSLSFGVHYTKTQFDITGSRVPIYYDSEDYGFSVRGEMHGKLGGLNNRFTWGLNASQGDSHNKTFGPFRLSGNLSADDTTDQFEDIRSDRRTTELYAENSIDILPTVTLIAGAQAVVARRHTRIDALRNPPGFPVFFDVDHNVRYSGFSPKLGALWQATPAVQVFANISRSFEPPTGTEFYNAAGPTRAQKALTYEVGTRGKANSIDWEVALYHSRVENELLKVPHPVIPGRYEGGNIPRTTHSGLELRLHRNMPLHTVPGALDWNLAYTYNRFRIENDAMFTDNALPGIPDHYAHFDVLYRHPTGTYLGPSFALSSGWHADQANRLKAPGYGVVNFTLGYAPPGKPYRLFLDMRNLANKRYAASSEYLVNANARSEAFNRGLERAVIAGLQLRW